MAKVKYAPYRTLKVGNKGGDVVRVQRAMNTRASRIPISSRFGRGREHGVYSNHTSKGFTTVSYYLGLHHRHPTPGNQRLVRWPWLRPRDMKRAEKARKAALARKRASRGPNGARVWALRNVNVKENPPGSNRGGSITVWQRNIAGGGSWLIGAPWCGVFVGMALKAAGVKGISSRVAAVAYIEDDAKAGRNGFRSWHGRSQGRVGDAVVLFGRGVHVELIVEVHSWGYVTVGGNTSCEGCSGSQSNGGQSAKRKRPFGQVYGCARPRYP